MTRPTFKQLLGHARTLKLTGVPKQRRREYLAGYIGDPRLARKSKRR